MAQCQQRRAAVQKLHCDLSISLGSGRGWGGQDPGLEETREAVGAYAIRVTAAVKHDCYIACKPPTEQYMTNKVSIHENCNKPLVMII